MKNSILNDMFHKLHLDDFVESQKRFFHDEMGGFSIPIEAKIADKKYRKYRHLPINWSISSITKDDLPDEFSQKAVNTVDMFRRKTYDLDYECMILFDYISGNIVSCNFSNGLNDDKVESVVYPNLFKDMHSASAHNHPIQWYSPPSGKNFQMLGFDFEEYELIFSK